MTSMKEGDIFFWQWKNLEGRLMPSHCCSHKAVFKRGVLRDTFWSGNSEGALRLEDIETEYQGNIHQMTEISAPNTHYYRPQDIVDMRHSNHSRAPVYLKAGATRDPETMRAHAQYQIERSESEIRMAKDRIERLNEAVAKIDAGKLDKVYL